MDSNNSPVINQRPETKKSRSVERVREFFIRQGLEIEIKELPSSTRTAQLAADAVGTALGSIVKSLVFIADNRTILTLIAGDQRADAQKIARCVGAESARIAGAEEGGAACSPARRAAGRPRGPARRQGRAEQDGGRDVFRHHHGRP